MLRDVATVSGNAFTLSSASAADSHEEVTIAGNTVFGAVNSSGYYLNADRGLRLKVTDNTFKGALGAAGILFNATNPPVSDYVVSGNNLDTSAAASAHKGIHISGGKNGTVAGNQLTGHTTGATAGVLITGPVGNQAVDNVVSGNRVRNYATGVLEDNSGGQNPDRSLVIGNDLHNCTTATTTVGAGTLVPAGTNLT
jgi:hypothetical protein